MPPDAAWLGGEVVVLDEPLRQRLLHVWTATLLRLVRQRRRAGITSTIFVAPKTAMILLMAIKKVIFLQRVLDLGSQPAQAF